MKKKGDKNWTEVGSVNKLINEKGHVEDGLFKVPFYPLENTGKLLVK